MKHVLPAAALLASGSVLLAPAARADQTVQPTRPAWGCVDPRATTALAIPDGRLRNRKWVEYVHRTGQCALLPAGKPFNVLAHQGPLLLLKSPGASEDSLAVYAQSSDMTATALPPAAPGPAPSPAPAAPQPEPVAPAATPEPAAPPSATAAALPATPDQTAAATPSAATPAPVPVPTPSPAAAPAGSASGTGSMATPAATDAAPAPAAADATVPPPVAPTPLPVPGPTAPTTTTAAAAPAPVETPAPAAEPVPVPPRHGSSGMIWLALIVVLALLALVGAAVLVSRQQRRFAHVEDADWPERDEHIDPMASPSGVMPKVQPEPTPQSFRKSCVEVLEQGGWTIQPSFAAGAAREGAPDILGRRHDALLAVRCRGGSATVTPEIIDEVAAMGQQARAHVIVLATPAPLTRRAHDEAMRLHVHVLDQDELGSLSA